MHSLSFQRVVTVRAMVAELAARVLCEMAHRLSGTLRVPAADGIKS